MPCRPLSLLPRPRPCLWCCFACHGSAALRRAPQPCRTRACVRARQCPPPPAAAVAAPAQVRLPFSREGLRVAQLNAERYAQRNIDRHVRAGKVKVPARWEAEIEAHAQVRGAHS